MPLGVSNAAGHPPRRPRTSPTATTRGAARAGAQALLPGSLRQGEALPDPVRATAAADAYLLQTGHSGTVDVTVDRVVVTVSFPQKMMILGIGGLASVTVTGRGEARAVRGITEEIP